MSAQDDPDTHDGQRSDRRGWRDGHAGAATDAGERGSVGADCTTGAAVPVSRRGFVRTGAAAGIGALGLGGLGTASAQSGATDYDLAEALQKSLYFFDANMCGDDVGEESQLPWRGDCHLHDLAVPIDPSPEDSGTNLPSSYVEEHQEVIDPEGTGTVDVSGGYHDAGDHVKFGMPEGYAASTVAWAVHEFEDAFRDVGGYDHVLLHLRRFADYFVNNTFRDDDGEVVTFCHQVSKGGDGYDHDYWGPAELQRPDEHGARPAYFATPEEPASDECAAAAAALAAIGEVFQGEDDERAAEYVEHAEALYEFALEHRGLGQYGAPHYESGGDEDDLAWASLWLSLATDDDAYLEDCLGEDGSGTFSGHVSSFVDSKDDQWQHTWVHSWDDVRGGLIVKLAAVTDDDFWWDLAHWHQAYWTGGEVEHRDGSGDYVDTTPAGFSWLDQWGSARYNAAAQFTALVYAKYRDSDDAAAFAEWALDQMEYVMGDSPIDYSLIVGFTDEHAERPHHDTAHGAITGTPEEPEEHRHTLWGALVGGPDADDEHVDETDDYILNEVAIDFNAGLVGALAGHYDFFGGDGEPVSPFPPEPDEDDRHAVEAELDAVSDGRIDVNSYLVLELFYPARYERDVSTRYYFEVGDDGSPEDLDVDVTYDQVEAEEGTAVDVVGPEPWDESEGIYYVEFDYGDAQLHGEYELSFALAAYGADWFDPTADPSYDGIPESRGEADTLPLYVDGELVFGVEPDGTTPDDVPPTAPSDLSVVEAHDDGATVAWSAASDDGGSGVDEYVLTVDGREEARVPADTTEATVDGLAAGSYDVRVRAVDGAGNESDRSGAVTVTVGDEAPCEAAGAADGEQLENGEWVCDVDGDGHYRDVDASGDVTAQDLGEFFATQHRDPWDSRDDLFDFNEDGTVGQPDVVDLFQSL